MTINRKVKIKVRSKSEEKRQLILDAATDCFCNDGFVTTSMDKIAKQAGVSKQTVYSHFGNKDELFGEAISQRCKSFQMSTMPADVLAEPRKALTAFAQGFIELLLSKEGMAIHRVCLSESQKNPRVSQLFYAAGPEPVIKSVSELLAAYHQQGLLVAHDSHMAAIQFLSMIKGEAYMRREYNTERQISNDEIQRYIKLTVAMFLKGHEHCG